MSKLLKFFLGLIVLHVLLLLVNLAVERTFKSSNQRRDDRFLKEGIKKPVIFFGNSRVTEAVDFEQLPCTFNYTSGAESIWCYYYRLKYILENSPNSISNVVIPAEQGQFYFNDSKLFLEANYWNTYVDFNELAELTGKKRKYYSLQAKSLLVPYANTFSYFFSSLDIRRRKTNQEGKVDFSFKKKSFLNYSKAQQDSLRLGAINFILKNSNDLDLGTVYLVKLIQLCRENNVELLFVKYPITKDLRSNLEKISKEKKVLNTDSIIHSNNCALLDYSELFDDNQNYFFDAHHLNGEGRAIITEKLSDFIKCGKQRINEN